MAAVRVDMPDASVIADAHARVGLMGLPLTLIALTVSHVDDVADLARLCRVCRVLNYMCLPQLYRSLTLTSYDYIRFRDELPEGCGSASPFTMGLNAVVSRPNVAALVRSLSLRGEWRDDGLEEHARVGRVPDSSMILNIAVRAAIDHMSELTSFSWELSTKLLEPAYVGLSKLPKLTSLTVRFPSSRHPRPVVLLPPMPHLRYLKITDIDPLCYPDDIAKLLLESKKLRELHLHWSKRMRMEREPSVTLHHYLRKCAAANIRLRIRKVSLQNLYAMNQGEFASTLDPNCIEDVTILNSVGIDEMDFIPSFVEASWKKPTPFVNVTTLRHDRVHKDACEKLRQMKSLEKLYFVNPVRDVSDLINSPRPISPRSSAALTPPSAVDHHHTASGDIPANGSGQPRNTASAGSSSHLPLWDSCINYLTAGTGPRLRHLLLPSRWDIPAMLIARLVRGCPNLEQLGLATEQSSFEAIGMLIPFLPKLKALRILIPTAGGTRGTASNAWMARSNSHSQPGMKPHHDDPATTGPGSSPDRGADPAHIFAELVDADDSSHCQALGFHLGDKDIHKNLKMIGLGWKGFELGDFYAISASDGASETSRAAENAAGGRSGEHGAALPGHTASHDFRHHDSINDALQFSSASMPLPGRPASSSPTTLQPPLTLSGSVLGKRKERNHDHHANQLRHVALPPQRQSQPTPSSSSRQFSHPPPSSDHLSSPLQARTPYTVPHPPPPLQASFTNYDIVMPRAQTVDPRPDLSVDVHSLQTDIGEPLSQAAQSDLARCLEETDRAPAPGEVVWRRKVKRVGWDVLKHWEIWGLDVQEI